METRPSTRASGPPGHECTPRANAMCSRTFFRSRSNSCGFSNRRGSRLAAPGNTITTVPAGYVDATDCGGPAGQPRVALDGTVHAQRFLDEPGNQAAVVTQLLLHVRPVADHLQRGAEQLGRGLLTGGEQERGRTDHFDDLGCGSVRILRGSQGGQHVVARFASPVLDVGAELLVEPLQRVDADRLVVQGAHPRLVTVGTQDDAELLVVLLREHRADRRSPTWRTAWSIR